ncbi:MAG: DUF6151 family protein [Paracoccaceae bacterium]
MTTLTFSCRCGQVAGTLDVPSPAAGNHVVCHCPDCRASAIHLGQPDPGVKLGTELWQTTPDRVTLTRGADRLAIQQLSPKGLYRWYASCCNTPLFNTLRKSRLAFVGLPVACLSDSAALGPLIGRAFIKGPDGKYRHEGFNRIGFRIAKMMLAANLSGSWRKTPFFDADGTPTAPVHVLTREERAAATPAT